MFLQLRAQRNDERGVVLVLVALAMVAILIGVALVLDYGNLRSERQDSKLSTDAAATAGSIALAPDGRPRPWVGVCSALEYLKANRPDLTLSLEYRDGDGTAISGDLCAAPPTDECLGGDLTTWAWLRATGEDFVADIKSGYVTPDPDFPEDDTTYAGDNGVGAYAGCDQLAVIIGKQDDVFFGGVAGAKDPYESTIRSVIRVEIEDEGEGVPAFLMLERNKCAVLSHAVGTGGGEGIIVDQASATEPGIIHVDSSGTVGCTGSAENAYAIYSTTIGTAPGIIVNGATAADLTVLPGIISVHSDDPEAVASTSTGISPYPPSEGDIVSRQPVDKKYNSELTITNVHAKGYTDATRTTPPPSGIGALDEAVAGTWRTLSCGDDDGVFTESKIFVNCTTGYSPRNVTFANATDVIFNGWVQVTGAGPGGRSLYMPSAQRVVIGGNGTRGLDVSGGRLGVNSVTPFGNDDASVAAACDGREGPGWPNTTKLVIFGGSPTGTGAGGLNVSGRAALCQTFVYLAGPKVAGNATYARRAITDESYDPTCTTARPCPKYEAAADSTNAHVVIQGSVQWSAPNTLLVQPPEGGVGVEDLALWTEAANTADLKSGGYLSVQGVFFLPNARVEIRSPASASPRDAQFIARGLKLFNGTLRMKPTPGNAVTIPRLGGFGLVR